MQQEVASRVSERTDRLVRLDRNNRLLVAAGLKRLRAGQSQAGIRALFEVAGREWRSAGCSDLGFAVGPRINAAGRLADMTLGIECLLADDPERALELATELDTINRARRDIEATMREQAFEAAGDPDPQTSTLVVFRDDWHPGVVGLVASRLKDRHHRPTIAFAPSSQAGCLQGSGRSIAGVHLRDALDLAAKRTPGAATGAARTRSAVRPRVTARTPARSPAAPRPARPNRCARSDRRYVLAVPSVRFARRQWR